MKVGTICYACDSGLGILNKSFYDNGILTDVIILEHAHHPTHHEWYPGAKSVPIRKLSNQPHHTQIRDFCKSMDVMLFMETPFDWSLIEFCRREGTKTIIEVMHECMPARIPYQPHLWLCPSKLDLLWADREYVKATGGNPLTYSNPFHPPTFLQVPVDGVRWRQRYVAKTFVHNAGHGGLKGRNGTKELLQAINLVKSPAKFIIRSQEDLSGNPASSDDRIKFVCRTVPRGELYASGDVFIFPEKFNGLSLPLQEARAAGMLVMATDRFPINEWLPKTIRCDLDYDILPDAYDAEVLIPPSGYVKNRIGPPYHEFDEAVLDPKVIAARIDEVYGKHIHIYSGEAREWAQANGWEALKPKYVELLESLL